MNSFTLAALQEKIATTQEALQKQQHWNDLTVRVNLDKLQDAERGFTKHKQETTAALHDRDKVIERLTAELKGLAHQLEGKAKEQVADRRKLSVAESKLRDQMLMLEVRHSRCLALARQRGHNVTTLKRRSWQCRRNRPRAHARSWNARTWSCAVRRAWRGT